MNTLLAIWPMVMSMAVPFRHEHSKGQHREKEPGIDTEEEHLEYAVERDQPAAYSVSLRQLVPDNDHAMQRASPMRIRPAM